MKKNKSPEEVMKDVTIQLIKRSIMFSKKKKRNIYIHKSSRGDATNVMELDPKTEEGKERLEKFLTPIKWYYTISGLGDPEEKGSINWRKLNMGYIRRTMLLIQVGISFFMKGAPKKNRFYRMMGAHIGKNSEIMQMAWLDHFRPELIFIGDHTMLGAFTKVTVHAYEGCGKFRFGLVVIGSNCVIGAGSGMGMIKIEDGVHVMPSTILSPYMIRIRKNSRVGWNPPMVKLPEDK